jgi:phage terminase small subunit
MRERLNVDTKLQPKQEKFCQEYLIDLNGSKSAIRAGYSEKTSREIASNLLTKVNIQSYIQLLREKQIKRTEVTADKVIKEIARIAFADPRNILDEEMKLKNIHELDENETACIQEINTKHTNIEGLMLSESKYKLH